MCSSGLGLARHGDAPLSRTRAASLAHAHHPSIRHPPLPLPLASHGGHESPGADDGVVSERRSEPAERSASGGTAQDDSLSVPQAGPRPRDAPAGPHLRATAAGPARGAARLKRVCSLAACHGRLPEVDPKYCIGSSECIPISFKYNRNRSQVVLHRQFCVHSNEFQVCRGFGRGFAQPN